MTDADATDLDWFLLDWLKGELDKMIEFNRAVLSSESLPAAVDVPHAQETK